MSKSSAFICRYPIPVTPSTPLSLVTLFADTKSKQDVPQNYFNGSKLNDRNTSLLSCATITSQLKGNIFKYVENIKTPVRMSAGDDKTKLHLFLIPDEKDSSPKNAALTYNQVFRIKAQQLDNESCITSTGTFGPQVTLDTNSYFLERNAKNDGVVWVPNDKNYKKSIGSLWKLDFIGSPINDREDDNEKPQLFEKRAAGIYIMMGDATLIRSANENDDLYINFTNKGQITLSPKKSLINEKTNNPNVAIALQTQQNGMLVVESSSSNTSASTQKDCYNQYDSPDMGMTPCQPPSGKNTDIYWASLSADGLSFICAGADKRIFTKENSPDNVPQVVTKTKEIQKIITKLSPTLKWVLLAVAIVITGLIIYELVIHIKLFSSFASTLTQPQPISSSIDSQ